MGPFPKPKELAIVEIIKGLYSIKNVIYYSASGGAVAIAYLVHFCPETSDALGRRMNEKL